MTNPSNLYAEKIFAEHPLVMWSLDDTADYVSLISDSYRNLANASYWTITGGTAISEVGIVDPSSYIYNRPFQNSQISHLEAEEVSGVVQLTATSTTFLNALELNSSMSTFALSSYFYTTSEFITGISIGYSYFNGTETVEVLQTFPVYINNKWIFISATFDAPAEDIDISFVIKANYAVSAEENPDYSLYVNGITAGQWSEEFNATSLGVTPTLIPDALPINVDYGVEAFAYGLQDRSGYYLVSDNKLMSKNTGIPIVFGATNNTSLIPNGNLPSLIIPGAGFLNDAGAHQTFTFEMWISINAGSNTLRRIFGPIASADGIYVDGPFIILKIGSYSGSFFVGEWARPMLIQIRLLKNSASMLLNGEQVILLDFGPDQPQFIDQYNELGEDNNWLGFYSYEDTIPMQIDCVAIYPYQTPNIVAKRRWVYGQAVEAPETINSSFNGTSILADYEFANYANNYTYPDLGTWNQGVIDNMQINNNVLSTPRYALPSFVFFNKDEAEFINTQESNEELYSLLLADNEDAQDEASLFLNLRPGVSWNSKYPYISFSSINFMTSPTAAIYGVFSETVAIEEEQCLFYIKHKDNGSYLKVSIDDTSIIYSFKSASVTAETVLYSTDKYTLGDKFVVGVALSRLASYYGGEIASFFSNVQMLECVLGNTPLLDNVFSGNIYSFNFANNKNFTQIKDFFSTAGIVVNNSDFQEIINYVPAYRLTPKTILNEFKLDVSTRSSWQDYVPLSYLAKNSKDASGDDLYTLDFIQFNINYPEPGHLVDGAVNTSNSDVRTYITFQYLLDGANTDYVSYTSTIAPPVNNAIIPGDEWVTTKYEVTDNTVIYLPPGVNPANVGIVVHIECILDTAIFKQIRIRNLELASQAYDAKSPKAIGTKLGTDIYPYKKSGFYFDYKAKNPVLIYKGSTPHLYTTRSSGFSVVGDFANKETRGLSIPINPTAMSQFKISSLQMAIRYDSNVLPSGPTQIFEVQAGNAYIKFMMEQLEDGRAKIYAINANTGQVETRLSFYWNGKLVKFPVLTVQEWGMLGVSFALRLEFTNYTGALRLNGPLVYNNISYYQLTALQEAQQNSTRSWFKVKYVAGVETEWEYWADSFIWEDVLVLAQENIYGANPADIYKAYTGTNKFIFGDEYELLIDSYRYSVFQDTDFEGFVLKPV